MYAWLDQIANGRAGRRALGHRRGDREGLVAAVGRRRAPRCAARRSPRCCPLGIAGLNLAGLGPGALEARLRRAAPRRHRRDGRRRRAARRHGAYVIFGHTHCAGPMAVDGPRRVARRRPGRSSMNAGCWTEEPRINTTDPRSPYRPGCGVAARGRGPAAARARHRGLRRAPRALVLSRGAGLRREAGGEASSRSTSSAVAGLAARARPACGARARSADGRPACSSGDRAAVDLQHAGAAGARPRPRRPRRGRCRRPRGRRVGTTIGASSSSAGRTSGTRVALDAQQLLDRALGARRSRPRRGGPRRASAAARTGSAPASPGSRTRATAGSRCRSRRRARSPGGRPPRGPRPRRARAGSPGQWTEITRRPASA